MDDFHSTFWMALHSGLPSRPPLAKMKRKGGKIVWKGTRNGARCTKVRKENATYREDRIRKQEPALAQPLRSTYKAIRQRERWSTACHPSATKRNGAVRWPGNERRPPSSEGPTAPQGRTRIPSTTAGQSEKIKESTAGQSKCYFQSNQSGAPFIVPDTQHTPVGIDPPKSFNARRRRRLKRGTSEERLNEKNEWTSYNSASRVTTPGANAVDNLFFFLFNYIQVRSVIFSSFVRPEWLQSSGECGRERERKRLVTWPVIDDSSATLQDFRAAAGRRAVDRTLLDGTSGVLGPFSARFLWLMRLDSTMRLTQSTGSSGDAQSITRRWIRERKGKKERANR